MRKFSKIFAVLLSVCIIATIFAVFASAATESTGTITHQITHNFESGSNISDSANGNGVTTSSVDMTVDTLYGDDGTTVLNKYWSYTYNGTANISSLGNSSRFRNIFIGKNAAGASNKSKLSDNAVKLSDYSYFTLDFDFAADQYLYEVWVDKAAGTKEEKLSTTMPTIETEPNLVEGSVRLSYSDAADGTFGLSTYRATSNTASSANALNLPVNLKYEGGLWHIYVDKKDTGHTLSNTLGEWNHFTYAIKTNPDDIGASQVRLYYNGSLIATGKVTGNTCIDIVPFALRFGILNPSNNYRPFSNALDNFKSTYYTNYSSGDDANGIDDLYDGTVSSIMYCEDTVYNKDYIYPAPNQQFEIEINDEKIRNPFVIDHITSGSVVKTQVDLLNINPNAFTAFTVVCDPETNVTLSDAAIAKGLTITKTAMGYSVSTGVKANMSLFTDMRFNLYLPKLEGMEITGVDGAFDGGTATVEGKEMFLIYATPAIDSFDAIEATITYKLNGKSHEYKAKLDALDYATRVAKTFDCGSEESILVREMILYKEAVISYLGVELGSDATDKLFAFKKLYESHGVACTCFAAKDISPEESAVDYSALLEKGVTSVSYALSLNEIGMVIYVQSGTVVTEVSYTDALGNVKVHNAENELLEAKNGYYFVKGVSAAYIDEIMTITVDGETGTYSLGKYITNNPTVNAAQRMYRYSLAAEDYKNVTNSEMETPTVSAPVSIEITSNPTNTRYLIGETIDLSGMVVIATLENGSKVDVTDRIAVNKVFVTEGMTEITVSYAGFTDSFEMFAEEASTSVSELVTEGTSGKLYFVEGYVAGFAKNGTTATLETVIKDINTDDVIPLKGMPEDWEYTKGDKIKVYATLSIATSGKHSLTYSTEKNPEDTSKTVVSQGNDLSYSFENLTTLTEWSDWQSTFNKDTLKPYTFIKLSSSLYFNRGEITSGEPDTTRRYITPVDKGNAAKPDGSRFVTTLDIISNKNLGTDGLKNHIEGAYTTNGNQKSWTTCDEVVILYVGYISGHFNVVFLDNDCFIYEQTEDTEYDNQDVIVEVANAYKNRGKYIQYDQKNTRRHQNISPEAATAQNQVYLDCSSFVNAVYYEAFGENIIPYPLSEKSPNTANFRDYAKDNYGKASDVLGYWLISDYTTDEAQAALLTEIRGQLQVGDVLVYRKNNDEAGHVYIYYGDDKFIHCAGQSYNLNSDPSLSYDQADSAAKTSGAIYYETADNVFVNTEHSRYLLHSGNYDISLLRPLNRGLTPTAETQSRMLLRGLSFDKSSDSGVNSAVYRNGEITYTLKVKNGVAYKRNISFSEVLSDNVTFVSGTTGMTLTDGVLTLEKELSGFETFEIVWTVRVNENAAAGSIVESTSTTVNGIDMFNIRHSVSGYTEAQMQTLAAKALEYATAGKTFDDPALMVEALYNEVFGTDLYSFSTAADVVGSYYYIYKQTETKDYYKVNTSSEIYGMVAPKLYGGLDVTYPVFYLDNEIVRLITKANISIGDVMMGIDGDKTVAYIYVGGNDFVTINSTDKVCTTVSMTTDSAFNSANILVTFFAYDKYVVLRPSMAAN